MPTTLAHYTPPQYGNIRLYEGAITDSDNFSHVLQRLNTTTNFLRPLRLSSNAQKALTEHNVSRFTELVALKDGWHFGQGKAMRRDSLAVLEAFLISYSTFPERLSLFLSEEGNLELVWRSEENQTTSLEFYADRIEYYIEKFDDEGEVITKDMDMLIQKLSRA